ncbi:type II toxin-antitoxin system VapC family toxin [Spirosoma soli]|uniref:Type II toxin-antitoxin system VapC family toxin n=1 Tax=Spirosoma soli TaxID=1770529 RepID=A0ABW5LZ84_9BACT
MTLLIDTQVLLWFQEDNTQLSLANKLILEDSLNTIWVSQVSLIEIAIKLKIGKLPEFVINLSALIDHIQADGFKILPLQNEQSVTITISPFLRSTVTPLIGLS